MKPWLTLASCLLALLVPALLPAQTSPPAPPPPDPVPAELRSPRATMRTFLEAFDRQLQRPGIDPLEQAATCLDLSNVPENLRPIKGPELALDLKDVLDRTQVIVYEDLPDDPSAGPYKIRIHEPHPGRPGLVTLAPVADGRWLFTAATVETIPDLLEEARQRKIVDGVVREGPETLSRWLRERIPAPLRARGFLLEHWQWLALLAIAFVSLLADRILTAALHRLAVRQSTRRLRDLDLVEVEKALRPVGLLAAALVAWPALRTLGLPTEALLVLTIAVQFVAATSFVWATYRLTDVVAGALEVRAARTRSKLDDLLVPLVRKTLKVFIAAFGLVFIADAVNLPLTSLLTGVGIGGLALALAAQDTVKNVFGSFTVILDQPFHVGDWVMIEGVEGTVAEVGFRSTRIRTFYDSLVTLPNSNLINAKVDNYGARQYRRWSTRLRLPYSTPPDRVEAYCEGLRELVAHHPHTRKDFFEIRFNEFGEAGLEILVYIFFITPDWSAELRERHRFGLDALRLAAELGIELVAPSHLFLRRGTPATAEEREAAEALIADAQGHARRLAKTALTE